MDRAVLVVFAYFLVSTKKLPPTSVDYQLINLFGAFGVGVNVFVQQAYPSIAIQIIWVAIALFGIYQGFSPQNHHKQK